MATIMLFIFFISIMILIVYAFKTIKAYIKKEDHKPALKVFLLSFIVAFVSIILVGAFAPTNEESPQMTDISDESQESIAEEGDSSSNVRDNKNDSKESNVETENSEEKKEVTTDDMYALITDFIDQYNAVADNKIINQTNYDIHEEHYRTEYRLSAFDNCVATYGEATDSTFEIIASRPGLISDGTLTFRNLRIYGNFNDSDMAKKALETIIPIIDPSITVEMIQEEYSDYINTFIRGDSGNISFYIINSPSGSEYKYELFIN